jgi:riboflavin biosynthesis pyrimidine reductase
MISTPDGEVDVAGRSGPLGGPADQARLLALRKRASVVLVGAGTVRAEKYRAPSRTNLPIAVVTRTCDVDFASSLFTSGAGIIVTTLSAPEVPVPSLRAGTTEVDLRAIVQQLPNGIVHVEGGPSLNAALLREDLVDAINFTFSPHIGGRRGPSFTTPTNVLHRFRLTEFETPDSFVFARYERIRD